MQIVVKASPEQKESFLSRKLAEEVVIHWLTKDSSPPAAVAYFDLCYEDEGFEFKEITRAPIFVNAVLTSSDHLPANAIRINAWNSFLNRPVWELTGKNTSLNAAALQVLEKMGLKGVIVPDEPGLIAVRIIAMIINEAYFAWGDAISSKADIDTAMKLGTNYPFGPFEWAGIIGLEKISALLQILAINDERYCPAPSMLAELLIKKTQ